MNAQDSRIGPSPADKAIGVRRPIFVVGTGAYNLPAGVAAYACSPRLECQISSITPAGGAAVTGETWQGVNLIPGIDYIPFPIPITSITINTTLGIVLWVQDYKI